MSRLSSQSTRPGDCRIVPCRRPTLTRMTSGINDSNKTHGGMLGDTTVTSSLRDVRDDPTKVPPPLRGTPPTNSVMIMPPRGNSHRNAVSPFLMSLKKAQTKMISDPAAAERPAYVSAERMAPRARARPNGESLSAKGLGEPTTSHRPIRAATDTQNSAPRNPRRGLAPVVTLLLPLPSLIRPKKVKAMVRTPAMAPGTRAAMKTAPTDVLVFARSSRRDHQNTNPSARASAIGTGTLTLTPPKPASASSGAPKVIPTVASAPWSALPKDPIDERDPAMTTRSRPRTNGIATATGPIASMAGSTLGGVKAGAPGAPGAPGCGGVPGAPGVPGWAAHCGAAGGCGYAACGGPAGGIPPCGIPACGMPGGGAAGCGAHGAGAG